ncbi:MAG TPA: rRNA adenine N-6-methyltransferase family protein [Methylocella sp.]|nr:rRNA adenine N-6-methyltransferase family protein [Methylocella sp.]
MASLPARASRRGSSKPNLPIETRIADEARFFRSWLDNPAIAGAVSPSGRFLARMMARYVDPLKAGPVIELGPGTGAITEALLERGISPGRLFLVEFDPRFCKLLKRRFPGVHIIKGDAYSLKETLGNRLRRPPAAIVSSLPLLLKPEIQRVALLADAFQCMRRDGCFVQFTYGPLSPIPRDKASSLEFHVEGSPPVWLNLPPARVWIYRQQAPGADGTLQRPPNPAQEFLDKLRLGTEKIHLDLKKEIANARARLRLESRSGQLSRQRPQLETALKSSRGKASGIDNSHHL